MKNRALLVGSVACSYLFALAVVRAQNSGPVNVKDYGAKGNGTADDTAAIRTAAAALPATGGSLYFPPGNYLVSSTIAINVPVTIYGDGDGSNDLTQTISQVSCTSPSTDCILATARYAHVHDVVIGNTSGVTATGGAGFDYCSSDASYFSTLSMEHVTIEAFYNGLRSCTSEAGHITDSRFLDSYYDGLYLGTGSGGSSNLGDYGIVDDTFTCAGPTANAAVDYEGAAGGRIVNNNIDIGISPRNGGCEYGIYAGIGFPDMINSNVIQGFKSEAIHVANTTGTVISDNWFWQGNTIGPSIEIVSGFNVLIGPNSFTSTVGAIPYAILFGGSEAHTVVLPQLLAGYTAGQSGLPLYAGSGNGDLSTLGIYPYSVGGLTLAAPAGTPTFSPAAGTYAVPQSVTISDSTSGAQIYYTTDGSLPTTSSTQYSSAINVSSTETIQAIAVASGYTNSNVAVATYTIPPDFGLGLNTNALSVPTNSSGPPITVTVSPINGFSAQVAFACSGLPANTACSFVPATVTLAGGQTSATQLTVTNSGTARLARRRWFPSIPATALGALIGFIGFRRRRCLPWFALTAIFLSVSIGCGGSSKSSSLVTTTVTVTATAGTLQHAGSFTLTVQ